MVTIQSFPLTNKYMAILQKKDIKVLKTAILASATETNETFSALST